MKFPPLPFAVIAAALLTPCSFADDQPSGCKCEMMKKAPSAAAPATQSLSEAQMQQAELDKLVAEMNGNLGPKKLEAMAAIVTRLAEQSKAKTGSPAANTSANNEGAKTEAHQH